MKKGQWWNIIYPLTILVILGISYYGSTAVSTLTETMPINRTHCIIIDPGHGGEDGGATSCTGILESAFNLEISLKLEDLFHLLGYKTKMIRTEDISVYTKGDTISQKKISDLKERVRIVNETENALLLSIHQNQFSDSLYSGAQVFYTDTDNSISLARQLQNAFCTYLDPKNHRNAAKSSGIYIMEHIDCTGILIECGFLSNPEEEAKLRSPTYQKKLCGVIATTVASFLSNT